MKKEAYINKYMPKRFNLTSFKSGSPDIDAAVSGIKFLANKANIGSGLRNSAAGAIKGTRSKADKVLGKLKEVDTMGHVTGKQPDSVAYAGMKAKEKYNNARKGLRHNTGKLITEPDILAAGVAVSPIPIPGLHVGYLAGRNALINVFKKRKAAKAIKKTAMITNPKAFKYLKTRVGDSMVKQIVKNPNSAQSLSYSAKELARTGFDLLSDKPAKLHKRVGEKASIIFNVLKKAASTLEGNNE